MNTDGDLELANVLIAGCGYVGTALGLRLVEAGHRVFALRGNPNGLPETFTPLAGRISDSRGYRFSDAFDYVVCTIGAAEHSEAAYRAAYVDAVRGLVDAVMGQNIPPKRIVFTSSTAVYGQNDGGWVDEDSPTVPLNFSGRCVLEGERIVRASGVGVVLRLGGIYGPGRTRLIESVRDGSARLETGPTRYLNLNHRDDCAGALEHLLFREHPDEVYLGCDGHPEDRNAIIRWIAERLNVDEPATSAPGDAATQRQATNKRCSNRRLVASGYVFQYPSFREGYGALL